MSGGAAGGRRDNSETLSSGRIARCSIRAERTAQNVADSDGTLIISNGEPIGGTRETIDRCVEMDKPHLIIDHAKIPTNEIVEMRLDLWAIITFAS